MSNIKFNVNVSTSNIKFNVNDGNIINLADFIANSLLSCNEKLTGGKLIQHMTEKFSKEADSTITFTPVICEVDGCVPTLYSLLIQGEPCDKKLLCEVLKYFDDQAIPAAGIMSEYHDFPIEGMDYAKDAYLVFFGQSKQIQETLGNIDEELKYIINNQIMNSYVLNSF